MSGKTSSSASRLGLLAVLPLALFALAVHAHLAGALPLELRRAWVPSLGIDLAFRVDALALVMVLLITGIGSLVFVYAAGYMAGAAGRGRLFSLLLVFLVAMLGCVTTDDLVVLFVFWELTSIVSFLLVGTKHEYEASRRSARQALVVTGTGGLVLLAGVLLLVEVAGTSSIQAMLASAPAWRDDPRVSGALICVFVGAFTKSAQVPFHFWLPGAMAAPTPVSAYLHSATMVKLGVYLLARLHPAFGELILWQLALVGAGTVTAVWAMVLTVQERDLKRILAWSTVSALGMLVMLIGLPGEGAATAAAAFLLAHALYKAPLFFVAGNVDLATGTRRIDDLSGLGRRMPWSAAAGWMAGLSMAGIPLSFGYVAKDVIKIAKSDADVFRWVVYAGVFVSAASVAAAGVATARIFWRGRPLRPAHAREGGIATWLPPLLLASLGIALGLFPAPVEALLSDAGHAMGDAASMDRMRADESASAIALAATIGLGLAMLWRWDQLHDLQKGVRAPGPLRASGWYAAAMAAIPWVASRVTRRLQSGRLSAYTAMVFGAVLVAVGLALVPPGAVAWPDVPSALDPRPRPPFVAVAGAVALTVGASIAVCVVRDAFVMLLVSGLIGLSCALLFLFSGAPDVAFTQLAVEVAFVVVLASILLRVRRLEPAAPPRRPPWTTVLRALLALGLGGLVGALVLLGGGFSPDPALTAFFSERSVPAAHGRNVVNVILVDFRAVDTLGEIVVVTLTFLASVPLLRLLRARRRVPGAVDRGTSPRAHLLDVAVRGLYPLMLVGAGIVLLRGHNEPGGGFIGGMIAVAATALLAVARGAEAALARMPLGPRRLAVASALVSLASGLPALALGRPFLTHLWGTVPLGFTELKVSTVLLFDLGVFGAVWGALGGLCARAIELDEPPRDPARPGAAVPPAAEGRR
jgi:multicomponent Na+:H+ antiporter subunit A